MAQIASQSLEKSLEKRGQWLSRWSLPLVSFSLGVFLLGAFLLSVGCDDDSRSRDRDGDVDAQVSVDISDVAGERMSAMDAEVDAEAGEALSGRSLIESVSLERTHTLSGLSAPVEVIFTEGMVPNIYAESDEDLGRALGYLLARDRFFNMDLLRRLPQGRLSELFGGVALAIDQESLDLGMGYVTDRLEERVTPRVRAYLEAVASGVNDYIEAVRAGEEEAPSEFQLAAPLFATEVIELMSPWTARDIVSMATTILYQTNFEDGDLEASARLIELASAYGDDAERRRDFIADVALNMRPPVTGNTMRPEPSWGEGNPWFLGEPPADMGPIDDMGPPGGPADMGEGGASMLDLGPPEDNPEGDAIDKQRASRKDADRILPTGELIIPSRHATSAQLLRRLHATLSRRHKWFGRDRELGFGSNAWAASSAATGSGAIVSGDGHLQLSIPSLMYQVGLNTSELGDGDIAQKGLLLASIPMLAVGTNGQVAWSQVNPIVDITDWYEERLILDETGLPKATLFQGEERPLVATTHRVSVAERVILMSEARDVEWTSYQTFDGRRITQIDGRELAEDESPAEGEVVVTIMGRRVVPAPPGEDGSIAAISFDYGAFDASHFVDALFAMGLAQNLSDFERQTRRLVGGGLFSAAADQSGSVLYTSYQAVPCRGYLSRDADGFFLSGQSPLALLDGSQIGGFTIPVDGEGYADESSEDPYQCVIPYEQMPISRDPARGFVVTTNNDPLGFADDGRVDNDPWYLGGPWTPFRHHTVTRALNRALDTGVITVDTMRSVQANVESRLGELFTPHLIAAIDQIDRWAEEGVGSGDPSRERALAIYNDHRIRLREARDRLEEWVAHGYLARSGVETFYHVADDRERRDAVATMIFNVYVRELLRLVWSDEAENAIPYDESRLKIYALHRMLEGRGPDNPRGLASWRAENQESTFFDRRETADDIERSEELMVRALNTALEKLTASPEGDQEVGFGSADMSGWLWGLRHLARFESLLGPFLGDVGPLGLILERFSVTTAKLPLADELSSQDPRASLKWFPRPGDQWGVDAANPGFGGDYTFGNGPVMRMTIQLNNGRVSGYNIVPGGQSGLEESPHILDQLRMWLANDAYPIRYHLDEVVEGASARWRFTP